MKVCLTAPQTVSMVSGGPKTQMHQTAKFLPDHGIEVKLFDQWESLEQKDYDFVHLFGASYINHDLALRFSQFKIPYIVSPIFYTLHHPLFIRFSIKLEKMAKNIFKGIWTDYGIISTVCHHSSGVLPNTEAETLLIKKGFKIQKKKIHTIPNGVEPRFSKADPSLFINKYGIKEFILNVGHIGSLRKNILNLVKALTKINHPAVIIGKIHQNSYSNRILKEASTNKNILIIEGIEHDSKLLESAYAACDVFTLPSYFETPGIAALEAALAGAKIVITPNGGTKEYFKDDAIYVNHASINSIRRGIEQALNQKKNNKLKDRILEEYNWQKITEKTVSAYQSLLSI
jgi:glycosyltransferase involved in cell wall biosynthesis